MGIILLSFIETTYLVIIYHIIFIGVNNNIKPYIVKSIFYGILGSIVYIFFINIGVGATSLVVMLLSIITSMIYGKNIIVNTVELAISTIIISIVEMIFIFITYSIVGDIYIHDYIYVIFLLVSMNIVAYTLYKIMKNKEYNFDEFIEKYNNIIWVCCNIVILVFFIKNLLRNDSINIESILEIVILFFVMIAVNIYYFVDIYKKDKNKKKSEIKESINPLIQELIDEMKASEHEYKNHLNILYCMIQVCKEDELRDRAKSYIGNVFENKNLLNNLSNIENTILKAVLLSKINQAEKNEVTCNYKIESQLEGLPLDDSELTVVLSNLLNNAIEAASKSDKKTIEISTENKEDKYRIIISNSVNNLTEEMIPDISKIRFSTKGKGRGYGLYNIKSIVNKYKGKIHISLNEDIFNIVIEI